MISVFIQGYKIIAIRSLICLIFFLIFSDISMAQEGYFAQDYRSVKSLSFTGGLIGIGVGGEVRVNYPAGRFIFFGSAGYKGSGVQDSVYKYYSKSYLQIVTSDCKGPVLKAGGGIRINRKEDTVTVFIAISSSRQDYGTYAIITETGYDRTFPALKSNYLVAEVSSLPTGEFIKAPSGLNETINLLVPANNIYISAKIRHMEEINSGRFLRTWVFDYGIIATPDFKQIGFNIDSFIMRRYFNFDLTLGAIRRFDKPEEVNDPFGGDGMYKWAIQFQATFGFTLCKAQKI